jgi:hypothetical protein
VWLLYNRRCSYVASGAQVLVMAVPLVSHEHWERTRGVTQLLMGTHKVDAGSLSFARQLRQVVAGGSYRDVLDEYREQQESPLRSTQRGGETELYHQEWGPDGVTLEITPDARDRPHRPEVPDDLVDDLDEVVLEDYPTVPVDAISFDEKLELLLEAAEEYYGELNCRLAPKELFERKAQMTGKQS